MTSLLLVVVVVVVLVDVVGLCLNALTLARPSFVRMIIRRINTTAFRMAFLAPMAEGIYVFDFLVCESMYGPGIGLNLFEATSYRDEPEDVHLPRCWTYNRYIARASSPLTLISRGTMSVCLVQPP